jgi:hypothetical protein
MRSTLKICIAVKEDRPATEQELRYALEAMGSIETFITDTLRNLLQAIEDGKGMGDLRCRASLARGTLDRMFDARKKPVDEWLGPDNLPGSPTQQERLAWGKRLFKAATGQDLG